MKHLVLNYADGLIIGALVTTNRRLKDVICTRTPLPIFDLVQGSEFARVQVIDLNLSDSELTCVDACVLARCLDVNFTLTKLDISKNNIGKVTTFKLKLKLKLINDDQGP